MIYFNYNEFNEKYIEVVYKCEYILKIYHISYNLYINIRRMFLKHTAEGNGYTINNISKHNQIPISMS